MSEMLSIVQKSLGASQNQVDVGDWMVKLLAGDHAETLPVLCEMVYGGLGEEVAKHAHECLERGMYQAIRSTTSFREAFAQWCLRFERFDMLCVLAERGLKPELRTTLRTNERREERRHLNRATTDAGRVLNALSGTTTRPERSFPELLVEAVAWPEITRNACRAGAWLLVELDPEHLGIDRVIDPVTRAYFAEAAMTARLSPTRTQTETAAPRARRHGL